MLEDPGRFFGILNFHTEHQAGGNHPTQAGGIECHHDIAKRRENIFEDPQFQFALQFPDRFVKNANRLRLRFGDHLSGFFEEAGEADAGRQNQIGIGGDVSELLGLDWGACGKDQGSIQSACGGNERSLCQNILFQATGLNQMIDRIDSDHRGHGAEKQSEGAKGLCQVGEDSHGVDPADGGESLDGDLFHRSLKSQIGLHSRFAAG